MPFDIRQGRGGEVVLFNLLKNKPKNIDITIVETDAIDKQRISNEKVNKITRGCDIIKIHRNMYNISNYLDLIKVYLFEKPIFSDLKLVDNETLRRIRSTDIVYLFYNPYSVFFKNMNIIIIGTAHAMTPSLSTGIMISSKDDLLSRVKTKKYIKKYFYINGYHSFFRNDMYLNLIKKIKDIKYEMVLPNGVDTSLFYPDYDINNNNLKVLFVASLEKEKGLDMLLPLIDRFKNDRRIEFNIAGGGTMEKQISSRKHINYHGILNDDDLAKLYRECDIFIYPSHFDSYSLVILQALASGLYVICSDYFKGKFDEFGDSYLEYLPLSIETFYNRINKIIQDKRIIYHNKQEEFEYIKNNYSWEIISKDFYDYMTKFYNEYK